GWPPPRADSVHAPARRGPTGTFSAAAFQPGLDEPPGNRLRRRSECLPGMHLLAREPACVLELAADAHLAAARRARLEPDHDGGWEWPGLRGVIVQLGHGDARLFGHLAQHCIFQTLTRLDESRDGRVTPRRPARLSPEQRALTIAHQHDDRRVDA